MFVKIPEEFTKNSARYVVGRKLVIWELLPYLNRAWNPLLREEESSWWFECICYQKEYPTDDCGKISIWSPYMKTSRFYNGARDRRRIVGFKPATVRVQDQMFVKIHEEFTKNIPAGYVVARKLVIWELMPSLDRTWCPLQREAEFLWGFECICAQTNMPYRWLQEDRPTWRLADYIMVRGIVEEDCRI